MARWHERAYQSMREAGEQRLPYLGLDLVIPAGVFAPTPTSELLGRAVQAESGRTVEGARPSTAPDRSILDPL